MADVFDALTSRRPYQSPWSIADARALLEQGRGKHFDPDCLQAFLGAWDEVLEAKERLAEDPVPAELLGLNEPALV